MRLCIMKLPPPPASRAELATGETLRKNAVSSVGYSRKRKTPRRKDRNGAHSEWRSTAVSPPALFALGRKRIPLSYNPSRDGGFFRRPPRRRGGGGGSGPARQSG